jgi:uncharacterized protein (DUF433 family)
MSVNCGVKVMTTKERIQAAINAIPEEDLDDLYNLIRNFAAAKDRSDDRIVKTPGVCGGDARIKGTRLSIWGLEEWRRLGWSDAQILDAYPQLKPEDLSAAWDYVVQHHDEIENAIRENQEA